MAQAASRLVHVFGALKCDLLCPTQSLLSCKLEEQPSSRLGTFSVHQSALPLQEDGAQQLLARTMETSTIAHLVDDMYGYVSFKAHEQCTSSCSYTLYV